MIFDLSKDYFYRCMVLLAHDPKRIKTASASLFVRNKSLSLAAKKLIFESIRRECLGGVSLSLEVFAALSILDRYEPIASEISALLEEVSRLLISRAAKSSSIFDAERNIELFVVILHYFLQFIQKIDSANSSVIALAKIADLSRVSCHHNWRSTLEQLVCQAAVEKSARLDDAPSRANRDVATLPSDVIDRSIDLYARSGDWLQYGYEVYEDDSHLSEGEMMDVFLNGKSDRLRGVFKKSIESDPFLPGALFRRLEGEPSAEQSSLLVEYLLHYIRESADHELFRSAEWTKISPTAKDALCRAIIKRSFPNYWLMFGLRRGFEKTGVSQWYWGPVRKVYYWLTLESWSGLSENAARGLQEAHPDWIDEIPSGALEEIHRCLTQRVSALRESVDRLMEREFTVREENPEILAIYSQYL